MKKILLGDGKSELHLNLIFDSEASARLEFEKAKKILDSEKASIFALEIFAPTYASDIAAEILGENKSKKFPLSHILPLDESESPALCGAHISALAGVEVKIREVMPEIYVSQFSLGAADFCQVFGNTTKKFPDDEEAHSSENLENLKKILADCGFNFGDMVRTWFYNDDILSWYPQFNKARTALWMEENIFDGLLPASTGIGAPNPSGAKISSGVIALKTSEGCEESEWKVRELESPLQCAAPKYGSSFSRAVEIKTENFRKIFISGTASIAPDGKTVFFGDIEKQIDLTMRVIEEILSAANMSFSDTLNAIVYCRKPEYYEHFLNWQKAKGLELPHVPAYSIVCRDDLMFEVELSALQGAK